MCSLYSLYAIHSNLTVWITHEFKPYFTKKRPKIDKYPQKPLYLKMGQKVNGVVEKGMAP